MNSVSIHEDEIIPLLDGYLRQCILIINATQSGEYKLALEHAKAQANNEFKEKVALASAIVKDAFWGKAPERFCYEYEAMINALYAEYSWDIVQESIQELNKLFDD